MADHPENLMDKLVSLAKRRGFVFQSSEIYGGIGSVYDYGPLGAELKNNRCRPSVFGYLRAPSCSGLARPVRRSATKRSFQPPTLLVNLLMSLNSTFVRPLQPESCVGVDNSVTKTGSESAEDGQASCRWVAALSTEVSSKKGDRCALSKFLRAGG